MRLHEILKKSEMAERKLTGGEKRSKESHFKKLKKHKDDFKKRYGDEAEQVMHAIATNRAKGESIFDEPIDVLTEAPDLNNAKSDPIIYVDMDGVLADFFAEWAKLAGVKTGNYKDIPPAKTDPTLDMMVGTDFFNRLPKFPSADKLLQMVKNFAGGYKILSSPLRGDHQNSGEWKKVWIKRELPIQPTEIIIVGRKDSYAVNKQDGTPNILIDDRGKNIESWRSRGGYGIKYQADEDSLDVIAKGLEDYKNQYMKEPEMAEENNTNNNYGISKNATLADLDRIAKNSTSKEKRERAHWLRNMRRGRK
jgi:5'(3')-deoxyribonucleotidase